MEKIDLNNYEAYFLDYMEGTLSAEEKNDLFVFLSLHPKLKEEMEEDFGAIELFPEEVVFDDKPSLKIDESQLILTENTVDDIMIASVEGQLSTQHAAELDAYVKENQLEKNFAYYKATVLKADKSIVFGEKRALKVKTGIITMTFVTRVASIAAVGAILVTLALNWNGPGNDSFETTGTNNFASEAKSNILPSLLKNAFNSSNNTGDVIDVENELVVPNNVNTPDKQFNVLFDELDRNNTFVNNDEIEELPLPEDTASIAPMQLVPNDGIDFIDPNDFANQEPEAPLENEIVLPNEGSEDIAMVTRKTEEPYKLVTDAASNIVNRDIEFTREKNLTSNEYVAYSFKLGKFEFERKKSK